MGSLQRHKSFWKDACERNEAAVNVTKTWIRHAWEKTSNRSLREERNTEKCKRQRKDGLIYRAWWSLSVAGKQWGDIKLTKSSSNWEPFGGGLTLNSLKSFFGVLKVWDGAWNLNVSLNIILALFASSSWGFRAAAALTAPVDVMSSDAHGVQSAGAKDGTLMTPDMERLV